MTRDANLYILSDKDWQPLANTLKDEVVIFQLMTSTNSGNQYAILSLSEKADKVVEEYGATPASDKDLLRNRLHEYSGDVLFGDKSNIIFLNKI
jgi:hypothetical protein